MDQLGRESGKKCPFYAILTENVKCFGKKCQVRYPSKSVNLQREK